MLASELYHHGIKGQKWGLRRFQNADGSLTAEGVRRYQNASGVETTVTSRQDIKDYLQQQKEEKEAAEKAAAEKAAAEQAEALKQLNEKKQAILNSRSASALYANANLFTTSELQEAYTRLTLEKNISNLTTKEVSKGQQFVNSAIKTTKQISELTSNSISMYNNVAKILNTCLDENLPIIGTNNNNNNNNKNKDKK